MCNQSQDECNLTMQFKLVHYVHYRGIKFAFRALTKLFMLGFVFIICGIFNHLEVHFTIKLLL